MSFTEKGFIETKIHNGRTKGTKYFLRVEQDGATAEEYLGHEDDDDDEYDILDDYLEELWDK